MTDTCYFCGIEATTDEHAPPRCIFPKAKDSPEGKDYRKNLIKVPSCEAHNTEKSKEDEYLLYILAMCLPSNEVAKNQFLTKIRRAIERRPKLLDRLLIQQQEVTVHDTIKDEWHKTIAIKPEEHRLVSVFTHIAKALYFYEKKQIWKGGVSVLIEFMLSFTDVAQNEQQNNLEKELNNMLQAVPYKGDNQDVFSYQIHEEDGRSLIRLHFYGNTKVTVVSVV